MNDIGHYLNDTKSTYSTVCVVKSLSTLNLIHNFKTCIQVIGWILHVEICKIILFEH